MNNEINNQNEVVNAQSVEQPQVAVQQVQPQQVTASPELVTKKKSGGLVAVLIIIIVLLLAGCGAMAYLYLNQQPAVNEPNKENINESNAEKNTEEKEQKKSDKVFDNPINVLELCNPEKQTTCKGIIGTVVLGENDYELAYDYDSNDESEEIIITANETTLKFNHFEECTLRQIIKYNDLLIFVVATTASDWVSIYIYDADMKQVKVYDDAMAVNGEYMKLDGDRLICQKHPESIIEDDGLEEAPDYDVEVTIDLKDNFKESEKKVERE